MTCSALNNEGISEIWNLISEYISITKENGYFKEKRKGQNKFWLLQTIEASLKSDFYNNASVKKELAKQLLALENNKTSPFEGAERLLNINS